MKHLKKYLESTEPPVNKPDLDEQYLNIIFADFKDIGATSNFMDNRYEIKIWAEEVSYGNLEKYIEYTNALNEQALDMKTCIDRVKDEYPTIRVRFYYDDGYSQFGGMDREAYYTIYLDNNG